MASPVHCNLCKRAVDAKRHIGVGTLILVLMTWGAWLFAIPFYKKRCTICKSDSLVPLDQASQGNQQQSFGAVPASKKEFFSRPGARYFAYFGFFVVAINMAVPVIEKSAPTPDVTASVNVAKVPTKPKIAKVVVPIVGAWIDASPYIGGKITILKKADSTYVMKRAFNDGSKIELRLVEVTMKGGRRFNEIGSEFKQYYVIDRAGVLNLYDSDGFIRAASPA